MGRLNPAHTGQPIQGLQGTQSIAPEKVEKVNRAATSLEEMTNVITKFSFATK